VNKQRSHRFNKEIFNFKKLNEVEGTEKYFCRGLKEVRSFGRFGRYQPRNNLVTDQNYDLLADSHIINRWKNYFPHLLNVHSIRDIKQIEIHAAEPLVPGHSHLEVETAIAKLKSV
jgi:hypothetical protein